jgi:hypothetical protein
MVYKLLKHRYLDIKNKTQFEYLTKSINNTKNYILFY